MMSVQGAIAPECLQRDEGALAGPELDAILGERGAGEIAELFDASTATAS